MGFNSGFKGLTSALDGMGQGHAPAALPPGKRPGIHCVGGWVGRRAGLDGCGKSRPPPGFDLRTVQSVASRYTDWAIPALSMDGDPVDFVPSTGKHGLFSGLEWIVRFCTLGVWKAYNFLNFLLRWPCPFREIKVSVISVDIVIGTNILQSNI